MSSLQDQLLKAGLVDQKQVAKANREKNRKHKVARKNKAGNSTEASARQQAPSSKAKRDRELDRKRQQAARLKELAVQAKRLIEDNRQDRSAGEVPYSFVYKKKVKKIFVTEAQRKQLSQGQLAIATYVATDGRKFELVPAPVGEKIAQRDETFLVDGGRTEKSVDNPDDAYREYQVPDDLIW